MTMINKGPAMTNLVISDTGAVAMSYAVARDIVELTARAQLTIATAGEIPADWIAKTYGVTRGQALTLQLHAQQLVRTMEAMA